MNTLQVIYGLISALGPTISAISHLIEVVRAKNPTADTSQMDSALAAMKDAHNALANGAQKLLGA